jgi:MoxR-like ATPase
MSKKVSHPLPELPREYKDIQIPGTETTMRGLAEPHPLAPAPQPYLFDPVLVAQVAAAVKWDKNVMITGPSGCGKTQLIMQLARTLGFPCIRFNFNGDTRASHLLGQQRPAMIDGGMGLTFVEGDAVQAARLGYWLYCDEIDMASPHVLGVLHPLLEEGHRTIHIPETGETVHAHPDFRIFAAGNTIGNRRAHAGRFAGTTSLNSALLSRFGFVIDTDYPEFDDEVQRVLAHLPKPATEKEREGQIKRCKGVCFVASIVRQDSNFQSEFSTRGLIQWAMAMEEMGDTHVAFELAVLNKLTNETDVQVAKSAVMEIFGWQHAPAHYTKAHRDHRRDS